MEQKVTIITTVKNEEKSIGLFLDSIAKQTRKPDEIIVVDGGSTDDTLSVISNFQFPISKIKVIKKRGNRSVGRNTAVKNSTNSIITCTDVGCILDKFWVERISSPFENKDIDVVAGFYKPLTGSIFEKCLATYTCTMADKLDKKSFLPSSRSVAFRKKAWEKAGGYPENLTTCEDLVFDKRLQKTGARFVTEEKAFVYWPQRKNIYQAAKQFYGYAVGDGQARYFRSTTPFLFLRYILGTCFLLYIITSRNYSLFLILVSLFIIYLFWAIRKNYKYVKKSIAVVYLPLLQLTSDVAVISGTIVGFMLEIWDTKKM